MKNNILIYDYETFGLNTSLDRPAQFACVRLNYKLDIICDPIVIFCKLSDDYLPDPNSILLTGISPQYVNVNGVIESNFAKKIYNIFTKYNNTCIIGFNNIKFDDEITRNIFYRNFYDPYKWSYINGNTKFDILNFIHLIYVLNPNYINFNYDIYKKTPKFSLKEIAIANKINNINNIHNALYDILISIDILKLIYKKDYKLFKFIYKNRTKDKIKNKINISKANILIYIPYYLNIKNNYFIISPIIWDFHNKNIIIFYNLNYNVKNLNINLNNNLFINKYLNLNSFNNDNEYIYPFIFININKCPSIFSIDFFLKKKFNISLNINLNLYKKNFSLLKNIFFKLKSKLYYILYKLKFNIFDTKYNINNNTFNNVDNELYKGFFNYNDKILMNKITSLKDKNKLLLFNSNSFNDIRLKKMYFKYIARNFPYLMNKEYKKKWKIYKKNILNKELINKYIINLNYLFNKHYKDKKKTILLNLTLMHFNKINNKLNN